MAYRKAGYSKKFLEGHREAITLHKAAKEAFEQLGLKKTPPCQGVERRVCPASGTETGGLSSVPKGKDGDAGVPCGAESGGCPSGKGEGTGGYGGAAQGGTADRSAQMILAGLAYRDVGQPRLFFFFPETPRRSFPSPRGAQVPPVPAKQGQQRSGTERAVSPGYGAVHGVWGTAPTSKNGLPA